MGTPNDIATAETTRPAPDTALATLRARQPALSRWFERLPAATELLAQPAWLRQWETLRVDVERGSGPIIAAWLQQLLETLGHRTSVAELLAAAGRGSLPLAEWLGLECLPAPLLAWRQGAQLVAKPFDEWPLAAIEPFAARCAYTLHPRRRELLASLAERRAIALLAACMHETPSRSDQLAFLDLPLEAIQRLALAEALLDAHQPREALRQLERARPESHASPLLLADLALLYGRAGANDTARELAHAALQSDPPHPLAHQRLAAVHNLLGDSQQAVDLLSRSVELQRQQAAQAAFTLGQTYSSQGNNGPARDAFAQAVELMPTNASYRLTLARLLHRLGQHAAALETLNHGSLHAHAEALVERARLLDERGDTAAALAACQRASELEPASPAPLLLLSAMQRRQGDLSAARLVAERAYHLAPASEATVAELGAVFTAQNQTAAARDLYQAYLAAHPASVTVTLALARSLALLDERPAAISLLRGLIGRVHDEPQAHLALGELLAEAGNADEALAALQVAMRLAPADVEVAASVGQQAARMGRHDAAITALQLATTLAPTRRDLLLALAESARAVGNAGLATLNYRAAYDLAPDAATARALSALAAADGEVDTARRWLAAALRHSRRDSVNWECVGALHMAQTQPRHAIRAYRRALQAEHRLPPLLALAAAYESVGRRDDALGLYEDVLLDHPNQPEALWGAAQLHLRNGRVAAALACAHQLAELPGTIQLTRAAHVALEANQPDYALNLLDQAVAREPANAAIYRQRAEALLRLNQSAAACLSARRACELAPDQPELQALLGTALLHNGDGSAAVRVLQEAVRSARTSLPVLAALRNAFAATRQTSLALMVAREIQALAPNDLNHSVALAGLLVENGTPQEAYDLLRPLANDESRDASLHATLARAALELGNVDEARSHSAIAYRLAPDQAEVAVLRAEVLDGQSEASVALATWEAIVRRWPHAARAYEILSNWYTRTCQPRLALAAMRRAIALEGDRRYRVGLVGLIYAELEQPADAARALAYALPYARTAAETVQWALALAESSLVLENLDEASTALDRALALQPEHLAARRLRVSLNLRRGQLDEAQADMAQLVEAGEESPLLFDQLADALSRHGQPDQAIFWLHRALAHQPDAARWRALALCCQQAQRWPEARDAMRLGIRHDPRPSHWASFALFLEEFLICEGTQLIREDTPRSAKEEKDASECHPSRSEGSWRHHVKMLRFAQHDNADDQANSGLSAPSRPLADQPNARSFVIREDTPRSAKEEAVLSGLSETSRPFADQIEAEILEAWAEATGGEPERGEWWQRYGLALARNGRPHQARAAFERAVSLLPDRADVLVALAESLDPHEEQERRTELARQAVSLEPSASAGWFLLGQTLRHSAPDEAFAALERAYELEPNRADYAVAFGLVALNRGDRRRARAALEAACEAPNAPAVAFGALAELLCEPQRLTCDLAQIPLAPDAARRAAVERPLALLAAARARNSRRPRWWMLAAMLEQRSGQHETALQLFDQVPPGDYDGDLTADLHAYRAISRYLVGALPAALNDADAALGYGAHTASMRMLRGCIQHDQGNWAGAIADLQAAMRDTAGNAFAHTRLGLAYLAAGQPEQAVTMLELALEQEQNAATLGALSDAYAASGQRERALQRAAQAVRSAPADPSQHQRLASLYQATGRLQEARASLVQALALDPQQATWHAQMGDICAGLRMVDAARQSFARARQLAPNNASILAAHARMLASIGEERDACDLLRRALEQEPGVALWHTALAEVALRIGSRPLWEHHYRAAARLTPEREEAWAALADALTAAGDYPAALTAAVDGLEHLPAASGLRLRAGNLALALGHIPAAIDHLAVAIDRDPQNPAVWEQMGQAYMAGNDRSAARHAFSVALELAPRNGAIHAALAQIEMDEAGPAAALPLVIKAVDHDPLNPAYQVLLAQALAAHGRHDESGHIVRRIQPEQLPAQPAICRSYGDLALAAEEADLALAGYRRALELGSEDPELHLQLGRCYRQIKDYRNAILHLRRAVRMQPAYMDALVELSTLGPLAFAANPGNARELG
jgi:tetratricopeptide (TPR) repeat protein